VTNAVVGRTFIAAAASRIRRLTVPNVPTDRVFIKIKCREKNLYTKSREFRIY
jgi:hypothetical protein